METLKKESFFDDTSKIEAVENEFFSGSHNIFLPSSSDYVNSFSRKLSDGNKEKYIEGSINGKHFEVVCDKIVTVSDDIYQALKPMLEKIKRGK